MRSQRTRLFVSSIKLPGVAVNLGGNCGGFLYISGAMLLFRSGRCACPNCDPILLGFRYWRIEGARAPKRRDARMAERQVKTATEMRRMRKLREEATVVIACRACYSWKGGAIGNCNCNYNCGDV